MNNDEKIDEILLLVRKLSEDKIDDNSDLKERVKNFMLENFNIRWLNDEVEGDIYEYLIDGIMGILKIIL